MYHITMNNTYLLEQAGNRLGGSHFPLAPHTQRLAMRGWAKSDVLLQKGEQNIPESQ